MKLRQTSKWSNRNDVLVITKERREDTETWQRRDWVFSGIIPKWRPRACFVFELWRLFTIIKKLYYYSIMTWLDTVIVKALKTSHDWKKIIGCFLWKCDSLKDKFLEITVISQSTKKGIHLCLFPLFPQILPPYNLLHGRSITRFIFFQLELWCSVIRDSHHR